MTKDTKKDEVKTKKKADNTKSKATKSKASVKKNVEKKVTKKVEKKTTKKDTVKKETKKDVAKKDTKKTTSKKEITKKTATTKTTSTAKSKKPTVKSTASKTTKKASTKVDKAAFEPTLVEYYDLPYRYNQTIVKILAQTPTTLFVYWDISDKDRASLLKSHGENFFYETRPILIVHNLTYNYSFEIEINDFANSWYIRTQEPNCDYSIELGRKFNNPSNDYIYINSSNDAVSPNDHILFENIDLKNVLFKNTKSNMLFSKDFADLKLINNMDKLYGSLYDIYRKLYNDALLNELSNPSSGEFYLKK